MLLIGTGKTGKSCRRLQSLLNLPRVKIKDGLVLQRCNLPPWSWQRLGLDDAQFIILWGVALPFHPRHGWVLNERIVFNKLRQLKAFHAAGISCPPWITTREDNWIFGPQDNPSWLGRRLHHRAGRDVTGPWTTEQMRDQLRSGLSDYGVQLINKTHEWRIHVFDGNILRRSRKVWPAEKGTIPTNPIWNASQGWHFRYNLDLRESTREHLDDLAKRAVVALGMDFGAVDIIEKRTDLGRNYYVLEVNSAPGIADNPNTLRAYANAMRTWANNWTLL